VASAKIMNSDMAVQACKGALAMARCNGEEVQMLICGTVTPGYRLPSNTCAMQGKRR